ncbi:MAG TPA: TonB family protein, partial [Candidatus Dormibacteraeota bacterium]|nr:TonB family protein [Candidatus Dormibacteraeota bacterium]
ARGEGVRQSDINAYAWATLAAAGGEPRAQALADQLRPDLAPGSERIAADLVAPFDRRALDARLMPRTVAAESDTALCKTRRLPPLEYPRDAAQQGIQGNVYVQFAVMPDGTTRNPRVLYALPAGVFERAVRQYVLRFTYRTRPLEAAPAHCHMMFRFTAAGEPVWAYPGLLKLVDSTRAKAEQGDVQSQYFYGLLVSGLPQFAPRAHEALPWFVKAAQAGDRRAQYQVGASLLLGFGCECEESKAVVWLRRAAESDQPDAQVTLAQLALRGTPAEADLERAKVWLERAAANGDHDGMYYLAALLAATPTAAYRDPTRALALLDKVKKDLGGDPAEFEIRAAAQADGGAFEQAVESERTAIERARRLQWDVGPLQARLERYQTHQPWYGNLLTF